MNKGANESLQTNILIPVCLRIIFIDYIDNDQIVLSPNPEWENI